MMNNRHAHRSNSNIKVSSLAKNHATKKHMCKAMWVWKGLMGCWGSCFLKKGKRRDRNSDGKWASLSVCEYPWVWEDVLSETLSSSVEPTAPTGALANASWNVSDRRAGDQVWRCKDLWVLPDFGGKIWSPTRMLSLDPRPSLIPEYLQENWVIFSHCVGISLVTTNTTFACPFCMDHQILGIVSRVFKKTVTARNQLCTLHHH